MHHRMKSLLCLVLLAISCASSRGGTLVQFRTTQGDIEVELYDQDKPATVENFLRYLKEGHFQNVFFHRCIPGFILQGGRYLTIHPENQGFLTPEVTFAWPVFSAVTNEFSVGRRLSNISGTLAMARIGGQTNSATSEWFFNLANNPGLDTVDGGFTVFGHVVRGTNVLGFFNGLTKPLGVIDMRTYYGNTGFGNLLSDLPVAYYGQAPPHINQLYYVDISVLNVQVRLGANRSREISWNSVVGRPNHVEFTTYFPPDWQILATKIGTGASLTVSDSSSTSAKRFYRVRVEY